MMGETSLRVHATARNASSNDDLVRDDIEVMWDESDTSHPLDEETLDERHSTQLGPWGPVRRDAD